MSQTEVQLIKDAVIVNADISNSAAIDISKISGAMPLAGGSFSGDVSFGDNNITNVGVLALDIIKGDADDNTNITFGGSDTITFKCGTTNPALTLNTTQVKVEDGQQFVAGTGNDLQILHSGGVNQILSGGANLKIGTSGETYALFENNASVQLYYDNEKMFTTNGDGAEFFDSDSNLNIYFTTNNTTRRGYIFVESTSGGKISFYDPQNHPMLSCTKDGAVDLYYDNSKKFETSSSGVTVSGDTSTGSILKGVTRFCPSGSTTVKAMWDEGGFSGAGHFQVKDGVALTCGDSSDLRIFHDGTDNIYGSNGLKNHIFKPKDTDIGLKIIGDGAVEAYYDNSKKFETLSDGVNVTGTLKVNGSAFTGGKILQVVQQKITNAFTYNSTSMNNVGISANITPSATSSKILVMFNINAGSNNNGNRIVFRVSRTGDDNEFVGDANGSRTRGSAQMAVSNPQDQRGVHISYISSPSSTSAVTYALQAQLQVGGGSYVVFGGSGTDSNNSIEGRTPQHITLIEIAG